MVYGASRPMTLSLFERSVFVIDPPKLRPYQNRAIQKLRDRVREGKRRILLVSPTASGKMTIIASIIRTSSVPVLFVCHRMELVEQCIEQLARLGIANVGVMRGDDDRTDPGAATQISSIQTLSRRKKPPAGLVIIDEAHRSASDSMIDNIFEAEEYRNSIILGFTATPTRYDGRPLGNLFESMEVVTTYAELIKEGFIIAPDCYGAPAGSPNLSGIKIVGGDYDEGALGDLMRDKSLVGNLLGHWLQLADKYPKPDGTIGLVEGPRRRTLIFATTIQHSRDICEVFEKAGVRIAHLDGKTPEDERRRIIKALGDGTLEAVSNCNVLLEGTDIPSAKCVVHARPTQSLVLWRQSVGRILRPWHPGCPLGCVAHPSVAPLLLDHAGNINNPFLGFPHDDLHWDLKERAYRIEKKAKLKLCKGCFAYVAPSRMLCPYCNYEFKPEDEPKEEKVKESEEQLVRRATSTEDMRRSFFDGMVQLARQKGYKPGYASAKFRDHYGAWPPWAWSEAIKSSFASDPEWQENYEANQTKKEQRAAAKALKNVEADERAAIEAEADDVPEQEDESFGGWLKEKGIE